MFKKIGNFCSYLLEKGKAFCAWATSQETMEKAEKLAQKIKVVALKAHAVIVAAFKRGAAVAILTYKYDLAGQGIQAAFRQALAEVKKMDLDQIIEVVGIELPQLRQAQVVA